MEPYRVVEVKPLATGGIEAILKGPGIAADGVPYWFDSAPEVESFVDNLNLSFIETKRLADLRKSRIRKRSGPTFRTAAAI